MLSVFQGLIKINLAQMLSVFRGLIKICFQIDKASPRISHSVDDLLVEESGDEDEYYHEEEDDDASEISTDES